MSNKVYEIITQQIIDQLKNGSIPWKNPWQCSEYPKNLISKKEYKGINVLILISRDFQSPYWITYKQAKELGGNVKKGEKSTMVIFWKQLKVNNKTVNDDNEEVIKEKIIPLLRYYRIFNTDQCEGIEDKIPKLENKKDFKPILICEKTVKEMPNKPAINHGGFKASYSLLNDIVKMPHRKDFEKEEFYYSVLFHELGHSTGHESRLNRKECTKGHFGSENYSKEELIAEMTASFLCGNCNIEMETLKNSTAYIQSWLRKLNNDSKMVVLAAAQAQKATDYILNKL